MRGLLPVARTIASAVSSIGPLSVSLNFVVVELPSGASVDGYSLAGEKLCYCLL